jgi:uncharacterized protein (DUF983 family)
MFSADKPSILTMLKRAVAERCPHCGEAKLFYKYLKQVERCPVCQEPWGLIRADDGPAWLTILIAGHIIVPIALGVEDYALWPMWVSLTVWPLAAIPLILLILPRAKAMFIGLVWKYCPPRLKTP